MKKSFLLSNIFIVFICCGAIKAQQVAQVEKINGHNVENGASVPTSKLLAPKSFSADKLQVVFPLDYCRPSVSMLSDLEPSRLLPPYDYPIIQGDNDDKIRIVYTDFVEKRILTGTFGLKREWKVFRDESDNAIAEHTQRFNTTVSALSESKMIYTTLYKSADRFILHQNVPNPYQNQTSISFYLPMADHAELQVRDVNSRLLEQIEGFFPSGDSKISLDASAWSCPGTYYYTLKTSKFIATRKMVIVH